MDDLLSSYIEIFSSKSLNSYNFVVIDFPPSIILLETTVSWLINFTLTQHVIKTNEQRLYMLDQ